LGLAAAEPIMAVPPTTTTASESHACGLMKLLKLIMQASTSFSEDLSSLVSSAYSTRTPGDMSPTP
jgi:hypothetical protein